SLSNNHYFFFFSSSSTPNPYSLSLHDALPILTGRGCSSARGRSESRSALLKRRQRCSLANKKINKPARSRLKKMVSGMMDMAWRSEEHTSELQSRENLVCRLLLEKIIILNLVK